MVDQEEPAHCIVREDEEYHVEDSAILHGPEETLIGEAILATKLAAPTVLLQVLQLLMWIVTAVYVGHTLGTTAFAAFSLSNLSGNLVGMAVLTGMMSAMETLAPQALGAGRKAEVGHLAIRCFFICMAVLSLLLPFWLAAEWVLKGLGVPPNVAHLAGGFLRLYVLCIPSWTLFEVSRRFMSTQHVVWPFVGICLIGALAHPLYLVIFVPLMGFDGAALAHVFTWCTLAAVCMAWLWLRRPYDPLTWPGVELRVSLAPSKVVEFLRLGVPGVFSTAEWWFWEIMCFFTARLGEEVIAAHTVAYMLLPMLYMIPLGISVGVNIRVGVLLGEGLVPLARRLALTAVCIGLCVQLYLSALLYTGQDLLVSLFATDPEVSRMAHSVWPLVSLFIVVDGLLGVQGGVIRGVGLQTRLALGTFASLYVVGLPLAYGLAFHAGLGLSGVWTAMPVSYFLMNVVMFFAWICKDWDEIAREVQERKTCADSELVALGEANAMEEEDNA